MTKPLKHAFIITAYRDSSSLKSLFEELLKIEMSEIFCQIDSRSISVINSMSNWLEENSEFRNRILILSDQPIRWGSSDHLLAQLRLAKLAFNKQADFYHTLSGQCRIISSANHFTQFFEKNIGKSFIETFPLPSPNWSRQGGLERISVFQLYDVMDAKKLGKLFSRLNKHFVQLQKIFRVNRLKAILKNTRPFGGLSYWSINEEAMKLILNDKLVLKRMFKHTFCSEEIIPHTILRNIPSLNNSIVNNSLRFVLWEESHGETPGILDESHLAEILNKDHQNPILFARKFDSKISKDLMNHLSKEI